MSLKDEARKAYQQSQEEREQKTWERDVEQEKRKAELLRLYIPRLFSFSAQPKIEVVPDPFFGVVARLPYEDLRFAMEGNSGISLIGNCPYCDTEVLSRFLEEEVELGEMLESFCPSPSHQCDGTRERKLPTKYGFHGACFRTGYPRIVDGKTLCPYCDEPYWLAITMKLFHAMAAADFNNPNTSLSASYVTHPMPFPRRWEKSSNASEVSVM